LHAGIIRRQAADCHRYRIMSAKPVANQNFHGRDRTDRNFDFMGRGGWGE
jgi:hypothetical protein